MRVSSELRNYDKIVTHLFIVQHFKTFDQHLIRYRIRDFENFKKRYYTLVSETQNKRKLKNWIRTFAPLEY